MDSLENIRLLEAAYARKVAQRPIRVLLEVGRFNGRAGVRGIAEGIRVASAAAASPSIDLVGISTFEGIVGSGANAADEAQQMMRDVAALAKACDEQDLFGSRIILSGGGSSFFDLAAAILAETELSQRPEVLLRSGCYLTHDDGMYAAMFRHLQSRSDLAASVNFGLVPALEVWAHVQSIPQPGRMICTLGKRDVGSDIDLPVLKAWFRPGERRVRTANEGFEVIALNDQHAYIDGPVADTFRVGDLVGFGVSHPCTTFDKWRSLMLVDDNYQIVDVVRTYF